MPSRQCFFGVAVSVGLLAGSSSVSAQDAAPNGGRFDARSTLPPLTWYAPSLGVATPRGKLVRTPIVDSVTPLLRKLTVPVSVRTDTVVVSDPSLHCPMPVAVRDSAAVPPMPVVATGQRGAIGGTLRGCVNSLWDRR